MQGGAAGVLNESDIDGAFSAARHRPYTGRMYARQPLSTAVNHLATPRLSLTSCVRGVMVRNTAGAHLSPAQRLNYFPATPLCHIGWLFNGRSEWVDGPFPVSPDGPTRPIPKGVLFGGPRERPCVSLNPGPVHGMMLLLMPDAVRLLTGIDPAQWLDSFTDVREVLPPDWVAMCDSVQHAADDATRIRLIEDFLDPRWSAARPATPMNAGRYLDWAQGLAMRAAMSAPGRSLRQTERRIKQWAGQPMRELLGVGRAERAFFAALTADRAGHVDWAGIAADEGYADQSHLCRAVRRITGFSPEALRLRIAEDEAFWAYRMWQ